MNESMNSRLLKSYACGHGQSFILSCRVQVTQQVAAGVELMGNLAIGTVRIAIKNVAGNF